MSLFDVDEDIQFNLHNVNAEERNRMFRNQVEAANTGGSGTHTPQVVVNNIENEQGHEVQSAQGTAYHTPQVNDRIRHVPEMPGIGDLVRNLICAELQKVNSNPSPVARVTEYANTNQNWASSDE